MRPQTPKPPFPYTTRDVEIEAGKDVKLAGTLTIPAGKGPFPAVLLISGIFVILFFIYPAPLVAAADAAAKSLF